MQVRVVYSGTVGLPAYETLDSAGMDLRALLQEPLELSAGERALIPTGMKIEIPRGFEGQVRPRSGLALKRGLTVLNAPGTIDADYRGDVGVILVNLSTETQTIDPGERVAQLVFAPVTRCEWQAVDELGDTQRGEGGFGSTGRS
ncbi:MAG: dUTP diphosphatase [Gemmatimonadetes bacterium]|nr:dUTP diphosphatase [Gemmatimonadota bacterium]MBT4611860.1 dUTP diphosphatase [Gemmatimonadota bacterium]MBT5056610.1 dUTP diphosphatase [Gemmatimonadota bacterium]MBT5145208.1 dUTP diphosphatase [Gemmatimonadota bacterium]MBT5586983.1 dUTP diphosphatase [Gemmatimonadota bacterium]